jgi:putative component of toxin-antitoxin plasmid stabilization module
VDEAERVISDVRQQAKNLARQGRIAILRRGRPVDPNVPVKGVVRLALPAGEGWRITKIGRRYY